MIQSFEKFIKENNEQDSYITNGVNTFKFELTTNYPEDVETLAEVLKRASNDIKRGLLQNEYDDLAIGYVVTELDENGEPIN